MLTDRATVTKSVILISVVGYILVTAFKVGNGWQLDVSNTLRGMQFWRFVTSSLVPSSFAEGAVAVYLLYQFRTLERQMGGRVFASMLLWVSVMASSLQLAGLITLPGITRVTPGPYPLLYASLAYYYRFVPKLRPNSFKVFGIPFSDKSFTYLAALQLALNDGMHSLLPAAAGLVSGLVYSSDNIGLHGRYLIPKRVADMCSMVTAPLLESEPEHAAQERRRRQQRELQAAYAAQLARMGGDPAAIAAALGMNEGMRARGTGGPGGAGPGAFGAGTGGGAFPPAPPPEPVEPSDEAISRLMGMGFERDAVVAALRGAQNNEQLAVNRLIG